MADSGRHPMQRPVIALLTVSGGTGIVHIERCGPAY